MAFRHSGDRFGESAFDRLGGGKTHPVKTEAGGGGEEEAETPPAPTKEELEAQQGQRVPKREAMSIVDAGMAGEVNAAINVNLETDDAVDVDKTE